MAAEKTPEIKIAKCEKKIISLNKKIKKLEKLNVDLNENNKKLLLSYANLQNYQKRAEKEIGFKEEEIKKKYISELIDVYDSLKKAVKDENPKDGLKLIINNIDCFFDKEQIKQIDCIGRTFDHKSHHAISTIEKDDCPDGEIVDEIKKGYMIGDKLLRPSQVIVAKKKE